MRFVASSWKQRCQPAMSKAWLRRDIASCEMGDVLSYLVMPQRELCAMTYCATNSRLRRHASWVTMGCEARLTMFPTPVASGSARISAGIC